MLLVLQGIDTAGKGGVVSHVVGLLGPEGTISAPRSSSPRPRSWPTTSSGGSAGGCPTPGMVGVFDRSHYEDVLVVRVHNLVPEVGLARRATTRSTSSRPS